jgi:hypothetical protein
MFSPAFRATLAIPTMICCRFGPTLHLTSSAIEAMFPRAFERIGVGFYRSKITSWMAAQEEDYRCNPQNSRSALCTTISSARSSLFVHCSMLLQLLRFQQSLDWCGEHVEDPNPKQ